MSESILRNGYLLAAMFLRNGVIDDEMLQALVSSTAVPKADPNSRSAETITLRKRELTATLLRANPDSAEGMALGDQIHLLVGLASILSMLGMQRKQAFVLKELLQRITPGLIEARKVGAAEMGIHPAAGLLALSNASHAGFLRIEQGMNSLLALVGSMYGALDDVEVSTSVVNQRRSEISPFASRLRRTSFGNGSFVLKVDILKLCISICEVLPDFEGALRYTFHLLNLSRGAILLPSRCSSGTPAIAQEEQIKLMNSIKRTVGAASKLGMTDLLADYWDDYLVRGIEAVEPPAALRVVPHSDSDLHSANNAEVDRKDPFIYNPFSKVSAAAADQPLIADEAAYFSVYLQNPFETDIEIDEISLLTEGCSFRSTKHSIVLGHFCCQRFTLSGTPTEAGTLSIVGCRAKIRYCKERDFRIFSKDWNADSGLGYNGGSQSSSKAAPDGPRTSAVNATDKQGEEFDDGPESQTISVTVLNAQPVISVQSSTLPQAALMVLEGEKKSFNLSIRNESKNTPVDFIIFTFEDSATTQLRNALMNKDLSPTDLYELELQLAGRKSFECIRPGKREDLSIPARETSTFTIQVLGIPGLVSGLVQIDYAHLGLPAAEVKDKFYTRQLFFPVTVTVNAGIEVPRCNILPFSGDFAWWNRQRALASQQQADNSSGSLTNGLRSRSTSHVPHEADGGQFTSLLARLGLGSHGDDHCVLLLDLRNVWPFPLSISVQVRGSPTASSSPADPWRRAYTVHESLQPGHVSRVVLLIPRIYVSEPHAPVPLIGNQRQFVVSASKLSVETERANREAFWFREELLKHVRGSWREDSTDRQGTIDLRRGIRLNARMTDALKVEDIEISLYIRSSTKSDAETPPAAQDGCSRFSLQTNAFTTLVVKIQNRSSNKLHTLLRIQPSLREQPHNIALDLSKRFAWTGMLQRALHPPLEPGEIRGANLGIMALCPGGYEIGASVEEVKPLQRTAAGGKGAVTTNTNDRRIWHAREPCLIDAVEHIQS
jgi:trafficking protein particle complex subunit 9